METWTSHNNRVVSEVDDLDRRHFPNGYYINEVYFHVFLPSLSPTSKEILYLHVVLRR